MDDPRPFEFRIAGHALSSDAVILDIELAPSITAVQRSEIEQLLHSLEATAEAGAFDTARIFTGPARRVLVESKASEPSLHVRVQDVDRRVLLVVHNCLYVAGSIDESVSSVVMRLPRGLAETERSPERFVASMFATGYPAARPDCKIRAEFREPGDYARNRRALIELGAPASSEQVDICLARIQAWSEVLFGGFAPDVDALASGDGVVTDADVSLFGVDGVELTTDHFGASEDVWSSLQNLVDRMHSDGLPIASLTIW
jgi:hypothetical protein